MREGLTLLRRWRLRGGDPEGLGRWPTPTPPDGVPLPRLVLSDKLRDRLAEDRTPAELHRAVHLVAGLVEAGVLAPNKWRAPYVFSGWLDDLVVQALEHQAKLERLARRRQAQAEHEVADERVAFSVAAMAEDLVRSSSLASLGDTLRAAEATSAGSRLPSRGGASSRGAPTKSGALGRRASSSSHGRSSSGARRPSTSDTGHAVTLVRIRVQATADLLERDVADVLRALGRGSMRALEVGDAERIDRVHVALRDGVPVDDVAARWAVTPHDVARESRDGASPGDAVPDDTPRREVST